MICVDIGNKVASSSKDHQKSEGLGNFNID